MTELSGLYPLYLYAITLYFSFPSGITMFLSSLPFQLNYTNQHFQLLPFSRLHVDRHVFFLVHNVYRHAVHM